MSDARSLLSDALRPLVPDIATPADRDPGQVPSFALYLVDRYAPTAPGPVKTLAAARVARWMLAEGLADPSRANFTSDGAGTTGYASVYRNIGQSALRGSGAMAMLAQWRVRRAGAIEETST